jgi:hypothetical protein
VVLLHEGAGRAVTRQQLNPELSWRERLPARPVRIPAIPPSLCQMGGIHAVQSAITVQPGTVASTSAAHAR